MSSPPLRKKWCPCTLVVVVLLLRVTFHAPIAAEQDGQGRREERLKTLAFPTTPQLPYGKEKIDTSFPHLPPKSGCKEEKRKKEEAERV